MPGRLLRRRRLLRPVGLPHHLAAGEGVGRDRDHPPASLLGRPGPSAAAGPVPLGHGHRDRHGVRARRCSRRPTCWAYAIVDRLLRLELVLDRTASATYFSLSSAAVAAAAHVVTGDRGAVLSGVAARRARRVEARTRSAVRVALRRRAGRPASPGAPGAPERSIEILGGGSMVLTPARAPASVDPEWERRRRLQALFGVACFGSLASALVMVILAPNGYTTRAYYGTDCRAQALLVGAAISIGLTLWREGSHRQWFTTFGGPGRHPGRGGHGRAVDDDVRRTRPSPSAAGSWWRAWRPAAWCWRARWRRARSRCACWSCRRCRSGAASPTGCTSGTGRCCW